MPRGLWKPLETVVSQCQAYAKSLGFSVKLVSGYRSLAEQAEIYRSRKKSPYPVARPGLSQHNYGLAVDLSTSPRTRHSLVVDFMVSHGVSWGGVTEPNHFQVIPASIWLAVINSAEQG